MLLFLLASKNEAPYRILTRLQLKPLKWIRANGVTLTKHESSKSRCWLSW